MRAEAPRFAFVLGTGRCGSTLVHEVLARHPDIGFLSNLQDNLPALPLRGRLNNPLYRRLPPAVTRKGRLRYAPTEGYRILDARVSPALSTPFRDLVAADATPWLAARMREFFQAHAASQGRTVFLHKFTGWPRAGLLRAVFPEARFLHVVRDGRAVANSWLQMPWWLGYGGPSQWQFGPLPPAYDAEWDASGRSFALLAGLAWRLLIDAFEQARSGLPPECWLEVRYEDVVADPGGTFGKMLSFLGLEAGEAFGAELARVRFSTGRTEAFRNDLAPGDLALLDASLGNHLSRYGYA